MVSVSPRLPDDLEYDSEFEAPLFNTDPRMEWGFHSLTLEPGFYSDQEIEHDGRAFAGTPDPGIQRRRRQQRHSDSFFAGRDPFEYHTVADGSTFRLVELQAGTGTNPIECRVLLEDSKDVQKAYCCLSYAWESKVREEVILLDGKSFPVTKNLLRAMQNLRKPRATVLIWIDQICIDQSNLAERAHQVSIMKYIFNQAHKVYVWLGEADYRSKWLGELARNMRRGETQSPNRLLNKTKQKDAIQSLLERPWFQRVWVIPEVVLSKHTTVAWTTDHSARASVRFRISWNKLVGLIRDVQLLTPPGFDKQTSLLGNTRQRISIITQMINSVKENIPHTDITQLLILGKSSKATDMRDKMYAFYALTYLTMTPDYRKPPELLFIETAHDYINSILDVDSYVRCHGLTYEQRTCQLMSILFSAGQLHQHQHHNLPSWIPDWTFSWHLAPVWCKSIPNFPKGSPKDDWTVGIRSDHRAGGHERGTFEILDGSRGQLRITVWIFDTIILVNEITPAATPDVSQELATSPADWDATDSSELRYGRHFFTTAKGYVGIGTPGITAGDETAILLGGDVPVVLRSCFIPERANVYKLLCECYIQSPAVMSGALLEENQSLAEDIVLT